MISKELTRHFPSWYSDLAENPGDYYLVLTDDMDSFYACRYLKRKFGLQIKGFYQFGGGLYVDKSVQRSLHIPVYVDCAVVKDGVCCFDNHRTLGRNHMAINPNVITDRLDNNEYFRKYCGSTLMLVTALYSTLEELEALTETEKEMILALDSFYIGYYKQGGKYKDINIMWLDKLGLKDILLPVLEKRGAQYFDDFCDKYHLNEDIFIDDNGILNTYADILPHTKFYNEFYTDKRFTTKKQIENITLKNENLFVAAEIYGGKYVINSILD